MATINYSSDVNLVTGDVIVEWNGLSAGDDGQPFACRGLELKSLMVDPAQQNWQIEGSIQINPVDFVVIRSRISASNVLLTADAISSEGQAVFLSAIRPVVTSGSSPAQSFIALFRRP